MAYDNYYQDLPVYLKRRITIVDWKGELEFGSEHEDTSAWMQPASAFWPRWLKNDHRMFAVMRVDALTRAIGPSSAAAMHIYPLWQDERNVLVQNRPPKQRGAMP